MSRSPASPRRSKAWLLLSALLCVQGAQAADIINLGTLPGFDTSRTNGISSDGSVVVGALVADGFAFGSFHWSAAAGLQQVPDVGDGAQEAFAASGDGAIVVGTISAPIGGSYGYRWTQAGGAPGFAPNALPYAISRDGSTIVGEGGSWAGLRVGFRWRDGQIEFIPSLAVGATAHAVSGDGEVIAGTLLPLNAAQQAFRWTSAGMQPLGTLGGESSAALGISDDGSRIVGRADVEGSSNAHAFLWTDSGMQDLGTLGNDATAMGISGDGRTVVGSSSINAPAAFLWTQELGMVDLNTYLPTIGIDLNGWFLSEATAVSFDGRVIAGTGYFEGARRAFVVTGVPSPGAVVFFACATCVLGRRVRPADFRMSGG